MSSKEICVSIALGDENLLVGKLWCHFRKGRERASFEYAPEWLQQPERFELEPALLLTEGAFHTQAEQRIFGAIGDSAPDRWGRVLMQRMAFQKAKSEGLTPHTLGEVDYLLGVNDEARQGALRFSDNGEEPFLSPPEKTSIPPLVDLPKLLSASQRVIDDDASAQDLRLLLAPGSSLGGARPKASVRDRDESLSIAKFPRKDDEFDVVTWEAVALSLAKAAGLNVSEWRLETIADKKVLIIRRFDREWEGGELLRIPFLSAMSMLGANDNEMHSYLEIVYALAQHGGEPEQDMEELWRRLVFSILISNTDDHLQNHGFLYERQKGWRLSPLYDVNPTPVELKPRVLSTMIDFDDSTASLDLAYSVISEFRISSQRADEIVREVASAVGQWQFEAERIGLRRNEIDRMASAFEHNDLAQAKSL